MLEREEHAIPAPKIAIFTPKFSSYKLNFGIFALAMKIAKTMRAAGVMDEQLAIAGMGYTHLVIHKAVTSRVAVKKPFKFNELRQPL